MLLNYVFHNVTLQARVTWSAYVFISQTDIMDYIFLPTVSFS